MAGVKIETGICTFLMKAFSKPLFAQPAVLFGPALKDMPIRSSRVNRLREKASALQRA